MTVNAVPSDEQRSAEERAEELMERVVAQTTRAISRFVGRAREEIEDVVAEARTLNQHDGQNRPSGGPTT